MTEENVKAAAETAAANALVRDTWRGRAWYRREMVRVLIPRVLAARRRLLEGGTSEDHRIRSER